MTKWIVGTGSGAKVGAIAFALNPPMRSLARTLFGNNLVQLS
jgi:hypothetical protein